MAGWQSGYAADCKSVDAGSIPTSASKFLIKLFNKLKKKSVDEYSFYDNIRALNELLVTLSSLV